MGYGTGSPAGLFPSRSLLFFGRGAGDGVLADDRTFVVVRVREA
jgi:hypothetical protein